MRNLSKGLIILNVFLVVTLVGCSKSKEEKKDKKVIVKEETIEEFERESFDNEKDYKIIDVIKKDKDLFVHVQAELENSKEAFQKGRFIADSIEIVNKEKLKTDNIENIKVFFDGLNKDMLFDGTNIVKELSQNYGGSNDE